MRYIPRNCIPVEAVLAKPILGANGEVLLNVGVKMKRNYIKRMESLGVGGAYVNDPISEDLEIVMALSDELKMRALKSISAIYSKAASKPDDIANAGEETMKTAKQIVEEILSHGNIMLNLFDLRAYDDYTYFHCVNVTVLSVITGIALGYHKRRLMDLAFAALLHDIGKVHIDPAIINKKGTLTKEEYEKIKEHPKLGYDMIKRHFSRTISPVAAKGILEHHERMNGSGYPAKKKSEQISEYARILAIADVYDALISDRPYRKGIFPVAAMEYIMGDGGEMFDLNIVAAFTRKIALFPTGTCVLLSNGCTALVMENFEGLTQRPLVKAFLQDDREIEPYFINLSKEALNTTIVAMVSI